MRVRVGDVPSHLLSQVLLETWGGYFPKVGSVVETTICTSSTSSAQAIYEAWKGIFHNLNVFIELSSQFPLLISLAFHYLPSVDILRYKEQLMEAIEKAWVNASETDQSAHVVGQSFCVYALPSFHDTGATLTALSGALEEFQRMPFIGNLGHPPPGEIDTLYQLDDSVERDIPLSERYFWQSDLSNNTIRLEFLASQDFDVSVEMRAVESALGRTWDYGKPENNVVQWIRQVYKGEEEVGQEVMTFMGKHDGRYVFASVEATKYFGLICAPSSFSIIGYAHDKQLLSSFKLGVDVLLDEECNSQRFEWILPPRPCFNSLLAVGINFLAK